MKMIVEDYVYRVEVDETGNALPTSLGQMKGDIIVFRGPDDPVRLAPGSKDQVLTCDPDSELGVKWA